ncbi:unnamed protein product [Miscanthus lutarioriparius]|uniref:MADS-box domain-containing protein n=1 Tax=Miscanthus lutarioriparius TaxID=422564 RepID=A0A811PYR1_9POAL|nr:unnamed protein product [Miscanthus lutarioriparius]
MLLGVRHIRDAPRAWRKKACELTTLCGIKLCVVVYGEGEAQPKVLPSDEEAKQLLMKFNSMLDVSSLKKKKNQEEFLHSRSLKLHEQVLAVGV